MHLLALVAALLGLYSTAFGQLTDPATLGATIKVDKAYQLLPACINQCLWDIGDNDTPKIGGDLAVHLSCSSPWINGCYCRGASAGYAHSFIASCATFLCTTPQQSDIEAGTSAYQGYCKQALGTAYKPEGADQPLPATSAGSLATTTGAASSRQTSTLARATTSPSSTPGSSSQPSSGGSSSPSSGGVEEKIAGLSKGAFIGVVVSASCSVLGLIFGIGFKVYKHKQQQKMQAKQQVAAQGVYYRPKA